MREGGEGLAREHRVVGVAPDSLAGELGDAVVFPAQPSG